MIPEIAKQVHGLYILPNGMTITPDWAKQYLKALESWAKFETDLFLNI